MLKILVFTIMLSLIAVASLYAEVKYNPYSNQWETTQADSQLEYNPYANSWSYN